MSERLIARNTDRAVYLSDFDVERIEFATPKLDGIAAAVTTLRQWADDADAVTVTAGNAVATLQAVVDRLGVFFDRFADLVEHEYIDQHNNTPGA